MAKEKKIELKKSEMNQINVRLQIGQKLEVEIAERQILMEALRLDINNEIKAYAKKYDMAEGEYTYDNGFITANEPEKGPEEKMEASTTQEESAPAAVEQEAEDKK